LSFVDALDRGISPPCQKLGQSKPGDSGQRAPERQSSRLIDVAEILNRPRKFAIEGLAQLPVTGLDGFIIFRITKNLVLRRSTGWRL